MLYMFLSQLQLIRESPFLVAMNWIRNSMYFFYCKMNNINKTFSKNTEKKLRRFTDNEHIKILFKKYFPYETQFIIKIKDINHYWL